MKRTGLSATALRRWSMRMRVPRLRTGAFSVLASNLLLSQRNPPLRVRRKAVGVTHSCAVAKRDRGGIGDRGGRLGGVNRVLGVLGRLSAPGTLAYPGSHEDR